MSDFSIRSDSVNVEEIMRQIRARIREKRGVDYTEQEIQELASVRLEKFLDPTSVRSDILTELWRLQQEKAGAEGAESPLYHSSRAPVRVLRRLLRPLLKLFVNPVPLVNILQLQERHELTFMVLHNLVVELTRLGIEVKNLKMQVESLSSRLDFDERRARSLEGVVQYRPDTSEAPAREPGEENEAPNGKDETEAGATAARARRRRRRRGRRGGPDRGGPGQDARPGTPHGSGDEERAEAASSPETPDDPSGHKSEPGS
jgi:hypothetical protein